MSQTRSETLSPPRRRSSTAPRPPAWERGLAAFEAYVHSRAAAQPATWACAVVLIGLAIGFASRFPPYEDATARFPGSFATFPTTSYGQAITWWLRHPFEAVPIGQFFTPALLAEPNMAGAASHCDKLVFRAFLPALNQLLDGGIWTIMVANHLAGLIGLWLVHRLVREGTGDAVIAAFATWTYAATWAGTWAFNDILFGDAVAVAWLLGAMALRRYSFVVACIFFGAFTDERVLTTAPLVVLFRLWKTQSEEFGRPGLVHGHGLGPAAWPIVTGGALYAAVRLALSLHLEVRSGTSMMADTEILLYHLYVSYPARLFKVFEFAWIYPLLLLGRAQFALAFAVAVLPALLVWDLDRSLVYGLPAVLAAVCFSPLDRAYRVRVAAAIFIASLLWLEPNASLFRKLIF